LTRFEADLTVGKNWRGRRGRGFLHDDQLVVVVKFRLPLLRLNEFRVRSKNSNRACKETYLSFPYFSSSLPNIRSFLPINLILWYSVVNRQLRQRTGGNVELTAVSFPSIASTLARACLLLSSSQSSILFSCRISKSSSSPVPLPDASNCRSCEVSRV